MSCENGGALRWIGTNFDNMEVGTDMDTSTATIRKRTSNPQRPILYTSGCPRCNILKERLDKARIDYEVEADPETMSSLGITTAPILNVGGEQLDFAAAIGRLREGGLRDYSH